MDTTLRDLVLKRLDADTKPEDEWSALVLAALEGPEELESLLEGPSACHPEPRRPRRVARNPQSSAVGPAPSPRIAFLRTITVEGFRGIGPKATLDLTPGPGLTLVVGRNGSGKSSFAEALELLLTGDTYRWENRSQGLEATAGATSTTRRPRSPPSSPSRARRAPAPSPASGRTAPTSPPPPPGPRSTASPAPARRRSAGRPRSPPTVPSSPTTSSARCSTRARRSSTTPSRRSSASTTWWTRRRRSSRPAPRATSAQKDADKERKALLAKLEGTSDERAARAREALAQKDWGLTSSRPSWPDRRRAARQTARLEVLQRLSVLPRPTKPPSPTSVKALREAAERQASAAQTVAGKSDDLASLLDHALRFHQAHGDGDCPVCGEKNALDKDWHQQKAKEAESLRQAAREASEARQATKARTSEARKLLAIDQDLLKKAARGRPRRAGRGGPEPRRARVPPTREDTRRRPQRPRHAIESSSASWSSALTN